MRSGTAQPLRATCFPFIIHYSSFTIEFMACELCESDGGTLIWRNEDCRVVCVEEPGYPGFCRAIWNAHVKELTDLTHDERIRFMSVVFAVEAALRELLNPDKVNLASLGNITPHLHWHVIPRFVSDPHFPNPIWSTTMRQPESPVRTGVDIGQAISVRLSRQFQTDERTIVKK
jgi:diadenosine tetraphosphate (Ap4A) HIT family hydrolase